MLTPNVVPDFTALRVAVVGDLIADHYVYARPTRLSREAPVLVLRHCGERIGAGGAANVSRNLWALGAQTALLGVVGRDANGRELLRLLESEEVDVSGVEAAQDWETPTKSRVLGAEAGRTYQQLLRIDREPEHVLLADVRERIADAVGRLAGSVDALLVSDYGYGLVDERVAEAARAVQEAGAIVVLDPRSSFASFGGIAAITPNLAELAAATGRRPDGLETMEQVVAAAGEFLACHEPRALLVTMGNRGMALFTAQLPAGVRVVAAGAESVVDVSGAGDTAVAAFTLGLAAGLPGARAMRLANAAAGVVVMESGAAICELSKLRSMLPQAPRPFRLAATVASRGA